MACLLLCLLGQAAGAETFFEYDLPQTSGELPVASDIHNIYVAEYGNDYNDGTVDMPLATLPEGLKRAAQAVTAEPVTVWLRGGVYYIDELIYISGAMGKAITIAAYPGEVPVITGAAQITNWAETAYMGSSLWSAPLDVPQLRALYGDDGARPISRWPKDGGTLQVSRPIEDTDDEHKFENQPAFFVNPGDVPASLEGATVRLLHWWKDELSGVYSYDPMTGLLVMNRPTSMSVRTGDVYWLENVLSLSLAPGEWAYDKNMRTLYYMPREGETPENTPLYAGLNEQLFVLDGVSGITFEGITFARTDWSIPYNDAIQDYPQAAYDASAAIIVSGSTDVHFARCSFRDIGSGCIRFGEQVKDVSVSSCTFEDIGAQAVYVRGLNIEDEARRTQSIVIADNEIDGYGRNFYNAAAILIIHARDVDIAHNEIHDGTYTAISVGWVWGNDYNTTQQVRVRNNLIYYIGQGMLSDMGGIYLLGNQPGTLVTGNIIHDVTSAEYGGWGIYLDEGSSGINVSNNLVYNCSAQGFHLHIGTNNTIENNIFAFNRDGQIGGSGKGNFTMQRNLIVGAKPHIRRPDTVHITMKNNTYREDGSLFVDAANGNYNVIPDAETTENGFIPWVFNAGRLQQ